MESDAKKLFQFTPGASFWGSFKYFAAVLFGLGYLAALPVQLLLHRRMGERYLNSVAVLVSMGLGVFVVASGTAVWIAMARWVHVPAWWNVTASFLSMVTITVAVPAVYLLHRYAAWRRERQSDNVHSRSWGVPFYLLRRRAGDKPASIDPAPMPAMNADAPPMHVLAELVHEFRDGWRQMLKDRSNGIVPQGWVPWVVVTMLQPAAFVVLGALLLIAHAGIGLSVVAAGIGMFVQGRVAAAFFREQVLDHRDSKIEQEVWVNIVQGKPHRGEQHGYAVPIPSRVFTPEVRDSIASRLIKADSRYAKILKPVQEVEGKLDKHNGIVATCDRA